MNRQGTRVGDALMYANTGPETEFAPGAAVGLHVRHADTLAIPDEDP